MFRSLLLAVGGLAFVVGCAHIDVHKVGPDDVTHGVVFYHPEPYLLVTTAPGPATPASARSDAGSQAPAYQSSLLWLPNPKEKYVVDVVNGWGTVDGSTTLKDGWQLSSVGTKYDSKGPETIGAVTGLIGAVAKLPLTTMKGFAGPGLYHIVFDEKGIVTRLDAVSVMGSVTEQ